MIGYGHYGTASCSMKKVIYGSPREIDKKFTPAQDMQSNSSKIIRLSDDGSIPADNPFVNYRSGDPLVDRIGIYGQIWSLGHRNPLGIDKDHDGQLWVIEMGPLHGDELEFDR